MPTYRTGLNFRQRRFAQEYSVDNNGTQAAIRAGYHARSASQTASRLMANNDIMALIEQKEREKTEKRTLTLELLDETLIKLVTSDPRKLYNPDGSMKAIHELDDDTAAAISGLEVVQQMTGRGKKRKVSGHKAKVKLWDKNAALQLVARRLGALQDNTVNVNAQVTLEMLVNASLDREERQAPAMKDVTAQGSHETEAEEPSNGQAPKYSEGEVEASEGAPDEYNEDGYSERPEG